MDKLNNINLTHLIEFFTFPLNRFLSGVVTGTEYSQKFDFIKQLIRDAEEEYSADDSQPVFVILDCNDENYSHYISEFDLCQDLLRKILEQLPGE